jgi:hypothetical protein
MSIPAAALALENRSIGFEGEQTLPLAYRILLEEWRNGNRDREVGLHLAFLAWYFLVEPPFITGFDRVDDDASLAPVFTEVHDHFAPETSRDTEVLFVFGVMATLFPWALGVEARWADLGQRYQAQFRKLEPAGLAPGVFEARGAYGDYFANHVRPRPGKARR